MPSWTIRRKFRSLVALLALLGSAQPAAAIMQSDPLVLERTLQTALQRGTSDGWHFADRTAYFSTVLDVGRTYELARHDDPRNASLKAMVLDLALQLNYDPLINRDAAAWYVRAAAESLRADPARGEGARGLLAKLDAEEADVERLAFDADADASANVTAYPGDPAALVDRVDADLRAFAVAKDRRYRALALQRAAQPEFPIALVPDDTAGPLWEFAAAAQHGDPGYDEADRAAARAMFSHRVAVKARASGARALPAAAELALRAPADEYFGQTRLSPIGVRNEIVRIGKYLDVGWGDRMTHDALYVVDSIDDWRRRYPRDRELPRLLLQAVSVLNRMGSTDAQSAAQRLRRVLTVEYEGSPEARGLLAS